MGAAPVAAAAPVATDAAAVAADATEPAVVAALAAVRRLNLSCMSSRGSVLYLGLTAIKTRLD